MNQLFDDIARIADPAGALPAVRQALEGLRGEALNHAGMRSTADQLLGFLWGLSAAGVLVDGQSRVLEGRISQGRRKGWL